MLGIMRELCGAWAWRMAWRDSRSVRWRLLMFSASIIFGVAALVTIGSLRQNMNDAVGSQAKSLLGADLMVSSRQPYSEETKSLLDEIGSSGGGRAREVSFSTMLSAGEGVPPKLVSLRGLDGVFPFYGNIVTTPADAWERVGNEPGVIVEASFLKNMNVNVGDMVKLGDLEVPVLGVLDQAPPSASGFAAFSPTVITSLDIIEKSNLTGNKSLVFYRTYFKLPNDVDAQVLVKKHDRLFEQQRLRHTTSQKRSENIEKAINRLYTFFNLIGFSALFLGGIGVAGAIHIHISERLQSVATLRCLGCSSARAFAVYLIQSIAMGVIGTLGGVLIGSGFVFTLKLLIKNLPAGMLPFVVEISPSWFEIMKASAVGVTICISFALLPLLAVRRVSPLAAFRREQASLQKSAGDPLRWVVIFGLIIFAFLLTWWDTQDSSNGWKTALGYVGFLVVAFLFLAATGKLLRWVARKLARPSWPFIIRQGIASLHRPNNQTGLFMVSIGLGTFLIFTLILMQNILMQWLDPVRMNGKPNMFLVDIPPEEKESVEALIADSGVKSLGDAPIVQMRLTEIKGWPVSELIGKPEADQQPVPRWILRREFRSTFREQLSDTEKVVEGEWIGRVSGLKDDDVIPVSFEQKLANDIGVKVGDELTVSIEGFGESRKLRIASLREVDWRSMNLNFFIVFPSGSIDEYVSFNVLAANSPDDESTVKLQQAVFNKLPFVNTIDLSLILRTVQSVLTTAGKTVQIMALFTVVTGAIVLVASLLAGRRVRIRESVLLRTLGASRRQISSILAVEYALLAFMATVAGSLLALLASYLLGEAVFEGDPYEIPWGLLISGMAVVVSVTVAIGMLLSRGISNQPPLQILRNEGRG